jgi:BolA protein
MTLNRKHRLENILNEQFAPSYLEVLNESHMHRVPLHSETHFKVVIVSEKFQDVRPLQRHKMIYQQLATELSSGLHALSLHSYTAEEWQHLVSTPASPLCAHAVKNHE